MSGARANGAHHALAQAREALASSAWAPLVKRAAAYLLGFALLVLVGSGRLTRWLAPPPRLAVGVAEAATALPAPSSAPSAAPAEVVSATADAGAPPPDTGEASDAGAPSAVASDGKVILNLAAEEDLRRLPGIGPTRAKAILALRGRLKKFSRVEDLLKVKGLGRRALARLRPLVRVD